MKYDYLIVGAGLFGSVCARQLTDSGYNCLVIDRRDYIGGNCATASVEGIDVHLHGPHIFHTSKPHVWEYLKRYTTVNGFTARPKSKYMDRIYSFPINLSTMHDLWGVRNPLEARLFLESATQKYKKDKYNNAEEYALGTVGMSIYERFYREYLIKQWGRDPKEIPPEVMMRQVVRTSFNDSYYNDIWQGIPDYTRLFTNLLHGIDVALSVNHNEITSNYEHMIYSGAIDEFYDYEFGTLEYRSLGWRHETLNMDDYQGVFMIAYPELRFPFTRIIEHKHFNYKYSDKTVISYEYPQKWEKGMEAYYPVNDPKNQHVYSKYNAIETDVIFGGRLGSYKYLNMDQTIERALELCKQL